MVMHDGVIVIGSSERINGGSIVLLELRFHACMDGKKGVKAEGPILNDA